ncbi:Uncharacterized protein TCM_033227 [Theobroma cacao]|uniref:Uncharacterized protein n=1 Tax=Theobroma cacao TaxID=3641 RepID=A0A061FBE4_THECC|nr:Uncharacterized protein TCM_033227 [Theobroma cacao]
MNKCLETGQSSTKETLRDERKGENPMAPRKESELRVSKHKKHTCSKRRFEPDQNKRLMKKQKSLESKLAGLKKVMNHEELQEYQEKLGQLEQNLAEIRMDISWAKAINDKSQIYLNSIIARLFS